MKVRCQNCNHYLGEAPGPLVFIELVGRSSDTKVREPRDLRICRSCQRLNVFVPLEVLDSSRAGALR